MKKVFKISSALFVAAFMCVFGSMTAFADILIKDKMIKRIQVGEVDNER